MGNIFGEEKPLKEVIRENQRMIKKSIRELEKEIKSLESNQKKLEADIKKHAKMGQMSAVRVMAKDYVRTKNYVTKFIEMKTHLNAVSLKMQTVKSHQAMADAMKGVTVALGKMNKKMNLPALQKIMAEFMKENEKAEITQEIMGDAIDDAMEEEGSAEEEGAIVNQVLDELGISAMEATPAVPIGGLKTEAKAAEVSAPAMVGAVGNGTAGGNSGGGGGGNGGGDGGVGDLEARLAQLKNS
jgi:charged multivesicular body protein 2A